MQTRTRATNGQKPKVDTNPTLFVYPPDRSSQETHGDVIIYTRHDHKQMSPGRYLNDTIISFFMQYHYDYQVPHELRQRLHVFSSFFFQKIKSIRQNKSSYANASRWLGDVNIFDKDFLVLPVCEKDHWVLVIICYPANKHHTNSSKIADDDLYEPAVIVLNSCIGLAPTVKKPLSQFLKAQWLRERSEERIFSINGAKKSGIRLIFPDLPQQRNSHDCGVYILGYFYSFLRDPRKAYIKMFRRQHMRSWFCDNHIDITRERRKMAQVVRNQIAAWRENHQVSHNNHELDSQEILSSSPHSSIDLVEDDMVEIDRDSSVIVIH